MSDPTCIPYPKAAVLDAQCPASASPATKSRPAETHAPETRTAETRASPLQYATADRLKDRMELHRRYGDDAEEFHAWLFRQVQAPTAANVLEVGCGTGHLWQLNRTRVPRGWGLTLSDLSEGMLDEARHNLRHAGLNVIFNRHGVQRLPYPDDAFDVVFANHMLYHVTDVPLALSEIRRVLKPGGRLYAATNGEQHMHEATMLLRSLYSLVPAAKAPEIDISPFSMETGSELLAEQFDEVRLFERRDHLVVTEPDPLLRYVLSLATPFEESEHAAALARWRESVVERFAGGVYHVKRVTGFFEAL